MQTILANLLLIGGATWGGSLRRNSHPYWSFVVTTIALSIAWQLDRTTTYWYLGIIYLLYLITNWSMATKPMRWGLAIMLAIVSGMYAAGLIHQLINHQLF